MPGPEVAVMAFTPAMEAPRQKPIEAISSSPWMQTLQGRQHGQHVV